MNYYSTRDHTISASAAQAIVQGICSNGGLFVPSSFPSVSPECLAAMEKMDYQGRAAKILGLYLTDFPSKEIAECVTAAYGKGKFSGKSPAPVVTPGTGVSFLELWHGPTCAFKDMALQILPHLLTRSLKKIHTEKKALILVATSGDTGKAALEGFRDVPGTQILVFYPKDGISTMQELQMCTQEGHNVSVVAVHGNFDDAQTGVKKIFGNMELCRKISERGFLFSSANSINWGRLLPQIVYYFSAWCDLAASGVIRQDEKVNFCVPTGNFGDILAAYYAWKMGLPIHRLICASNSNNVLTDFLTTGIYNCNRHFYTTISPSMDILVSSNLERLLFDITGKDDTRISGWMNELLNSGKYQIDPVSLQKIQNLFSSGFCSDQETREEISRLFQTEHYLCDPHTAVAAHVCREYRKKTCDPTHTVIVSTASPYKFAPDVLYALEPNGQPESDTFRAVRRLSKITGTTVPVPIAALEAKPLRHFRSCEIGQMGRAVLEAVGWRD